MRRKATVRELHLNTSEIIKQVVDGETFVIEKHGRPVAEVRPFTPRTITSAMPDREDFLATLSRVKTDSGRILEEDRT